MSDVTQKYMHQIYFRLADRTPKTRDDFLAYCWRFLADHDGLELFKVGLRDVEMQRPVVDQTFDVAITMIFDRRESCDRYTQSERHHQWITFAGSMSLSRRVCDCYVLERPARKKGKA